MTETLRIVIAQQDFLVGDVFGNADKIIACVETARSEKNADVIVFPELTLTGYPPEDLLLRPGLYERVAEALDAICKTATDIDVVVGYPELSEDKRYNSVAVIQNQKITAISRKKRLPNYNVFDEWRYFIPGNEPCVVNIKGIPTGILICEDIWYEAPLRAVVDAGAKIVFVANASPFDANKLAARETTLMQRVNETPIPIVYVNTVGGQDELVFDGASFVIDADSQICYHAEQFSESLDVVEIKYIKNSVSVIPQPLPNPLPKVAMIYEALKFGAKGYFEKNGFKKAIIGLSGGVDSALTLAIISDAIGSDKIHAVMMPSPYTAKASLIDAEEEAKTLGIEYSVIPINDLFQSFLDALSNEFSGLETDATEENIQARCRGVILMALSNKSGAIVFTTGNKSELSVGYATLYGDMAGGFSVIKDVPKTLVYELVKYRNQISPVIPQNVIDKPPSAELAPNQTDQDTLPPYDVLDKILAMYIEEDISVQNIIKAGFDEKVVRKIIGMVDKNEYKRRQAAPGVRITERAFGRDRRYPITSGYGKGH